MMETITKRLCPTTEDKERLNQLLNEMGGIIARSNTVGLEIDFDYWARSCFSTITGYGKAGMGDIGDIEIPDVFRDIFVSDD